MLFAVKPSGIAALHLHDRETARDDSRVLGRLMSRVRLAGGNAAVTVRPRDHWCSAFASRLPAAAGYRIHAPTAHTLLPWTRRDFFISSCSRDVLTRARMIALRTAARPESRHFGSMNASAGGGLAGSLATRLGCPPRRRLGACAAVTGACRNQPLAAVQRPARRAAARAIPSVRVEAALKRDHGMPPVALNAATTAIDVASRRCRPRQLSTLVLVAGSTARASS